MFLRKMGVLIVSLAVSCLSTVSFPANVTAEEIFPENFKKISSLYSYNDENPYISGDFVVWAAKSGPMALTHQIMLYDLSTNKELRLTNNSFDNTSPAVDGQFKLVVYKSVRNNLHGIYVCQYDPAHGLCPEVKISEDANFKYYTEVEGNRIVWVELASTVPYRRIYYCDYDFAGSCPRQMLVGGDYISRPNLEGNLLLWEDRTAYDGGTQTEHLFLHDFSTGKTYDLDKGDNQIGNMAALDGNMIVWAKQKFNVSLNRWERVLVSCEYNPQDAPNVCSMREIDTTMGKTTLYAPAHPAIAGPRVVYYNSLERDPAESVPMNHDIYHYNMGTGEILRLTTEVTSQANPMVSGNRVVWREADAFNNIFIWLYEFKVPNTPPVLAPIGGKTVRDGENLSFSVSAGDEDGQSLLFSHPLASDMPAGAGFSTTLNQAGHLEGAFSWTPGADQRGSHQVLFEVSDGTVYDSELVTIDVTQRFYCGDGIISAELAESCDSNTSVCVAAEGYAGTQKCNAQCSGFDACLSAEFCGDGILNGAEECDGLAGVGLHQECSSTCALVNLSYCGDGIVNGTEQCDGLAGVGLHQECSVDCTLVNLPYCGDGVKNGLEVCDLNSQSCKTVDGYSGVQSCSAQCSGFGDCVSQERCGDGIVNGREQCDATAGVTSGQKCTALCTLTQADDDSRKKVIVCHIPPGNPGKAHTIRISRSALKAHLAHGDTLGACKLSPTLKKQKPAPKKVTAASKNSKKK